MVDLDRLTEEEKKLKERLRKSKDLPQAELIEIITKLYGKIEPLFKGQEETLEALQDAFIFHAFVEQLTADDLKKIGATEASINDFLCSSIEDKKEAINELPAEIVIRLYNDKKINVDATEVKDTAQTGYRGIEKLRKAIIKQIDNEGSLQAYNPIKNITSNIEAESSGEDTALHIIIDYGEE